MVRINLFFESVFFVVVLCVVLLCTCVIISILFSPVVGSNVRFTDVTKALSEHEMEYCDGQLAVNSSAATTLMVSFELQKAVLFDPKLCCCLFVSYFTT